MCACLCVCVCVFVYAYVREYGYTDYPGRFVIVHMRILVYMYLYARAPTHDSLILSRALMAIIVVYIFTCKNKSFFLSQWDSIYSLIM